MRRKRKLDSSLPKTTGEYWSRLESADKYRSWLNTPEIKSLTDELESYTRFNEDSGEYEATIPADFRKRCRQAECKLSRSRAKGTYPYYLEPIDASRRLDSARRSDEPFAVKVRNKCLGAVPEGDEEFHSWCQSYLDDLGGSYIMSIEPDYSTGDENTKVITCAIDDPEYADKASVTRAIKQAVKDFCREQMNSSRKLDSAKSWGRILPYSGTFTKNGKEAGRFYYNAGSSSWTIDFLDAKSMRYLTEEEVLDFFRKNNYKGYSSRKLDSAKKLNSSFSTYRRIHLMVDEMGGWFSRPEDFREYCDKFGLDVLEQNAEYAVVADANSDDDTEYEIRFGGTENTTSIEDIQELNSSASRFCAKERKNDSLNSDRDPLYNSSDWVETILDTLDADSQTLSRIRSKARKIYNQYKYDDSIMTELAKVLGPLQNTSISLEEGSDGLKRLERQIKIKMAEEEDFVAPLFSSRSSGSQDIY